MPLGYPGGINILYHEKDQVVITGLSIGLTDGICSDAG